MVTRIHICVNVNKCANVHIRAQIRGFAKPKRLCRSVIPAVARMFRWETAAEFHLECGMRRAQLRHARLCKIDNIVFLRSAFYSRWHMALLQERRISIRPHRTTRALSILLITDSREILPESPHVNEEHSR